MRSFLKITVFILFSLSFVFSILFYSVKNTYADKYFYQYEIKRSSSLLYKNILLEVIFSNKLPEYLLIKPLVAGGFVEFYDFKDRKWKNTPNNWSFSVKNFPYIFIKVSGQPFKKITLSFELLNIKNGSKYNTNKLVFWSGNEFKEYIKKVNENILAWNIE
ncbi:MAG: hypothetical protein ACD_24C00236G0004 [uncultured bacterium]|uniref:Uncharacterized protein n=1 Tax=candidate division WWE3 bacterium RBG_16_37_10 TaxID=1802610 RepID=A0A1F4UTM2_UNCKA|nr:MAG: hypothetical protein ACD_24C00236G0004 [uncultured bacterium]OGC48304.1 MAG: hypothetical protein A2W32_03765 [candidate division WWE3 bacterium RBG_16_37_10]